VAAEPITLTQTFDNVFSLHFTVDGVFQAVTGDWIFTIVTDTSNPDLRPDNVNFGLFATSSVTFSNTGLGLVDVAVTSHTLYYEQAGNYSGLTSSALQTNSVLNSTGGVFGAGDLGNPNIIELGFLDFTVTQGEGSAKILIDPNDPLILANGMVISFAESFPSGSQLSSATPVPEPVSMLLLGSGLLSAAVRRCRQRRV
jgi:hypothetical protein